MIKKALIQFAPIAILIIGILPTLYGVWHAGFFISDDGTWMVIRFSAFYQALADGQFPVRFLDRLNNGYGYPVANFLYPGFMYFGIPLKLIGFDSLQVIKILISIFMIFGGIFSYFWLNIFFSKFSSFVGAIIFTYSPYHLYNLYKRGSLGELMSLALVSLILWMVEKKSFLFTSVGIFLLLISHNTLALLFLLFLIGYTLIRKRFIWFIGPGIVGGLLSSFFTIPAILELKYTQFSSVQISDPIEHFADLRLVGIGSIVILVVTMATLILVHIKRRVTERKYVVVFTVVISLFMTFFTVGLSSFVWQVIPSAWIQFPFRLLSITLVSVAFLASYVVCNFMPRFRMIIGLALISVVLVSSYQYLFPKDYAHYEIGFYDTNESLTTTHSEYMPIEVKTIQDRRAESWVEPNEGDVLISNISEKSHYISFDVSASTSGSVKVNRLYFPGWSYQVDQERRKIPFTEDDGLMYIPILRGEHSVNVLFGETPIRSVSNYLSILGVLILLGFSINNLVRKYFK